MAAYRIGILNVSPSFTLHEQVAHELNAVQSHFSFSIPTGGYKDLVESYEETEGLYLAEYSFHHLDDFRKACSQAPTYLLALVHGRLNSLTVLNLFGSFDPQRRVAICTTKDWETVFAPPPLSAYLAYYFTRYAVSFACPTMGTHLESRGCFFDSKMQKRDILWSMRTGTLCEGCAAQLLTSVDAPTFQALAQLGRHVRKVVTDGLKSNYDQRARRNQPLPSPLDGEGTHRAGAGEHDLQEPTTPLSP